MDPPKVALQSGMLHLARQASNDKSKNVKDAAVATSKTIMGTLADRNGSRNPNDLP